MRHSVVVLFLGIIIYYALVVAAYLRWHEAIDESVSRMVLGERRVPAESAPPEAQAKNE